MPGDKERLDWLEQQALQPHGLLLHSERNPTRASVFDLCPRGEPPTLREAIDLAMRNTPDGESSAGRYMLVPLEPPLLLLGHLTSYDTVHWMDEHDRNVTLERLRSRWKGILDAIESSSVVQQAAGWNSDERRPRP